MGSLSLNTPRRIVQPYGRALLQPSELLELFRTHAAIRLSPAVTGLLSRVAVYAFNQRSSQSESQYGLFQGLFLGRVVPPADSACIGFQRRDRTHP